MSFDVPAWRDKPELVEGDRRALAEWFDLQNDTQAMYIAELDGQPAGCAYLVTPVSYTHLTLPTIYSV